MARVRLVNVVKRYGRVVAVDHVNLDIGDGEFFALLGPSGCGKTTTLRIIAGLETPDEGEVYIDDRLVNDVHPRDRDVAMVFQNYALYPHMTVFDNIAFPLRARKKQLGLTEDDIRSLVVSVAEFLGIKEHLEKYPSQLSGGQQQRVALARALVRKPKVWLLDEPLSNLDAKLRVAMRTELKKIQMKLGITTVYVTHDQVEAMSMADRIAVMNAGRVLQVGSPSELYHKPADTFVATFIGSPPMNLLPCRVREAEPVEYAVPEDLSGGVMGSGKVKTTFRLECPGIALPIEPGIASKIAGVDEVYVGIRPEHLALSGKRVREVAVTETTVEMVENLGSEAIATTRLGDELVKVKLTGEARFKPGDKAYLLIDPRRVLVFDKKTGKLIV
ncbi:carbohydrate ABC transporter ATP-binding protein [Thermogladius calderae 1633]|uniref:Carbohydrate ABC transporter ATP-binding protein n=1 Tax=Thermogladius calderae (strain DSM 22663 / VKM B-2946 / 1633) TaxID=1184251 RepID=I3TCZ0_THEC1|nr:ABC transporter ATP-binding protein [Thermogladius calderae]AFK50628.1 carbohydrate ABC transporter ATP-binding protein [Thermogladius calderae 1633]